MTISRRDFLKGALAGSTLLAAGAPAEARENKAMPGEALGLLYDSTLCIGCKACVSACKEVNGMPPEFSTEDHLWDTPLDISGKTLNVIKVYKDGNGETKDSEKDGFAFMKVSCLHCVDPSCVSACPVSAMTKDPVTGIVGYDKDICIGCRYCVAACPFGVPRFQYDKALPQISKCQLAGRHGSPVYRLYREGYRVHQTHPCLGRPEDRASSRRIPACRRRSRHRRHTRRSSADSSRGRSSDRCRSPNGEEPWQGRQAR